jgi:carboxyl-terminal processing protease
METGEERGDAPRGFARSAIILAIVAAVSFGCGVALGGGGGGSSIISKIPFVGDNLDATPDSALDLTDFWKVYNTLKSQYVVTHASSTLPTQKELLWGAIKGLTASYGDPYTVFFPPTEAKAFADNIAGNFEGVGMQIDIKDNILTVVAPLKGTPSEAAGVKAGDQIASINGKSTDGMSTDDAVNLIRGPKGTTVDLNLVRDGKPLEIKIVRDTIQVPEIKYDLDAATGVYTIALYEFTANSAELFDTGWNAFKASGSKKLVVDLRGNPGGYLDAAVDIASHFLPKGTVIVTEDHEGKATNEVDRSIGYNDIPAGTKVVVLVDGGSASASEILSGALQDNKVATIIGSQSFGKGSVQQLVSVDGGSLKVTIARWLTPNGHAIMGQGITPDIKIDFTKEDLAAANDVQMKRAVRFLTTGK